MWVSILAILSSFAYFAYFAYFLVRRILSISELFSPKQIEKAVIEISIGKLTNSLENFPQFFPGYWFGLWRSRFECLKLNPWQFNSDACLKAIDLDFRFPVRWEALDSITCFRLMDFSWHSCREKRAWDSHPLRFDPHWGWSEITC